MPLRPRKVLHPRTLPWVLLAALAAAFSAPTAAGLAVGVPAIAAGVALRGWGAGHLVKTDRLIVSGPYAHLRHPLYAGTLLIGAGFLLLLSPGSAASGALASAAFAAWFFAVYFPRKERIESARLERRFGEPYRRYRAEVPALLPRARAWRPAPDVAGVVDRGGAWLRERFLANNEGVTALAVTAGVALLAVRTVLP